MANVVNDAQVVMQSSHEIWNTGSARRWRKGKYNMAIVQSFIIVSSQYIYTGLIIPPAVNPSGVASFCSPYGRVSLFFNEKSGIGCRFG